ncbi:UNVERIFIED_CONTAM: 3-ketoacyl-CoA thiolase 2, peroxisomal [Sesamum latifolium]|uniref:3-ketoacyl-CoA thiolase 2, peroxisomal n=1 Tax=Sesamum latifolium TaxID=2727402 RepID=A0AAW2U3I6_9LAMI
MSAANIFIMDDIPGQAFASQFVYCRKKLELDPEKINVNGGAMAIGHPLGATGTHLMPMRS